MSVCNIGKAVYGSDSFDHNFEIDFSKLNDCKGIYRLEIFVPIDSVPLVVQDGSDQKIREDFPVFLLESPIPLKKGVIKFSFQENENLIPNNAKKSATVRYLYCDE